MEALHGSLVFPRRVRRLAERIAPHVPEAATLLDIGCGDGQIAAAVAQVRRSASVRGVDVFARPRVQIPADVYDGRVLPYSDRAFDAVMLVDVLHHAEDAAGLLAEARRVCRGVIVVKDHLCDPWLGRQRLRLMDRIGNARHGVALRYQYWPRSQWRSVFAQLRLAEEEWNEHLGLYPRAFRWLVEDSLHFLARLRPSPQ